MTENDIQKIIERVKVDIATLETQPIVALLLNLVEDLYSENQKIKNENRKLKEKLTGEPVFFPEGSNRKNSDFSSEAERKEAESNDNNKHL